MDKLVYNYYRQVSQCWLQFHRVNCIFSWLTEVSHGIVKLIRFTTNISLGVSQGKHEFHMMLLKSHFKLKFSQHISQDQILYLLLLPCGSLNHRSFPFLNDLYKSYTKCHRDNNIFNVQCSGLSLRFQVAGFMQLVGGELKSPWRSPFGLIFLLFPTKKPGEIPGPRPFVIAMMLQRYTLFFKG